MEKFELKPGLSTRPTMLRLDIKQKEKIEKLSKQNKCTISEIVRQMVDHCLTEMGEGK